MNKKMKLKKPIDVIAKDITFGVEIETIVPMASGIRVGGRHAGLPLRVFLQPNGDFAFHTGGWKAERDGSIRADVYRFMGVEFVSPILGGDAGVANLCASVEDLLRMGAQVNSSCGLHITIGIESVIGTSDGAAAMEFCRKIGHLAKWHAKAIYGQTKNARHKNYYSHPLNDQAGEHLRIAARRPDVAHRSLCGCGRGIVNFKKALKLDASAGVIEFRAFSATLNIDEILHHLATVLGLCRRAHEVQCLGGFTKNKAQAERTKTTTSALEFLWEFLGWRGTRRPAALGVFGEMATKLPAMTETAWTNANAFEQTHSHEIEYAVL